MEVMTLDDDILEKLEKDLHDALKRIIGNTRMGDWDVGYLPRR
jgi:hypothetical protein